MLVHNCPRWCNHSQLEHPHPSHAQRELEKSWRLNMHMHTRRRKKTLYRVMLYVHVRRHALYGICIVYVLDIVCQCSTSVIACIVRTHAYMHAAFMFSGFSHISFSHYIYIWFRNLYLSIHQSVRFPEKISNIRCAEEAAATAGVAGTTSNTSFTWGSHWLLWEDLGLCRVSSAFLLSFTT